MLIGGTMMSKLANRETVKAKIHKKNNNNGVDALEDKKIEEIDEVDLNHSFSEYQELNAEQVKIADWLEKLKFRKQLVGGINEYDVWKKIVELNAMYEDALKTERLRCSILIDYYKNSSTKEREGRESEEVV